MRRVDEQRITELAVGILAQLAPVGPRQSLVGLRCAATVDAQLELGGGRDQVVIEGIGRHVGLAGPVAVELHPVAPAVGLSQPGGTRGGVRDDVVDELDAGHRGGMLFGVAAQHRILREVRRADALDLIQALEDARPLAPVVGEHPGVQRRGVHDDVVGPGIVAPAMVVQRADRHAVEDIAEHQVAAGRVVEVDAPGEAGVDEPDFAVLDRLPRATLAEPAEIVPDVVPDDVAALRPVARAGIESAGIGRLQVRVVDNVVLEAVVVARQRDAGVRRVVDQRVADGVADTFQVHRAVVGPDHRGDVVDVAVVHDVVARRQRRAVAAVDAHATGTGSRHVAAHDAAVATAFEVDAPAPGVAHDTAAQQDAVAAAEQHGVGVAVLDHEALEAYGPRLLELENLFDARRHHLAGGQVGRWLEVERVRRGVEIPLARRV